uniref:Uncharacterized protein n=1 Tax=Magallana gigas TaxID=29159 RepID=K1Q637_MAGGI
MMEREHRWENLWTCVTEDGYCGYVNSLAEAEQVRKEFEVEKSLTFVSGKREADFGNHGHVSKYERHCLFGKDKNKKKKEKYQNSRRQALLAKQDIEKARRIASEKLREDLEVMGSNIKREHQIYKSLPKDEEHQDMHLLGQITSFMNLVNKEVREKLYEMVGHGVTSVSEMRRHLKVYVDTQLFPSASKPSLTDAAYYPSDVTLRKHIYLAQLRLRYSKIDQENLMELVSQWQESYPKDNFDFMPATSNENQPMDEDNINDVQCVEQDDEDEVFSQLITTTNFFFLETKKFSLKRNFEKERKEREAAEKACIDALAQMEGFNRSEPTSEATNKLMKIWNQERATNYIKARVYGYNVNDADLMSLKSPNWLTDQVLDAYLSYLAQKEWDKGKKEKHLDVSKMTKHIADCCPCCGFKVDDLTGDLEGDLYYFYQPSLNAADLNSKICKFYAEARPFGIPTENSKYQKNTTKNIKHA